MDVQHLTLHGIEIVPVYGGALWLSACHPVEVIANHAGFSTFFTGAGAFFGAFAVARASMSSSRLVPLALRRTSPSVDVIQQAHNDAPDRKRFDLCPKCASSWPAPLIL